MICDDCVWYYTDEEYSFCEEQRRKNAKSCISFYFCTDENKTKLNKKDSSVCPNCQRDKDPGKCWWCEVVS